MSEFEKKERDAAREMVKSMFRNTDLRTPLQVENALQIATQEFPRALEYIDVLEAKIEQLQGYEDRSILEMESEIHEQQHHIDRLREALLELDPTGDPEKSSKELVDGVRGRIEAATRAASALEDCLVGSLHQVNQQREILARIHEITTKAVREMGLVEGPTPLHEIIGVFECPPLPPVVELEPTSHIVRTQLRLVIERLEEEVEDLYEEMDRRHAEAVAVSDPCNVDHDGIGYPGRQALEADDARLGSILHHLKEAAGDLDEVTWSGFNAAARSCRVCGCTDRDCSQCVEKTGEPCSWVEWDLCSRCVAEWDVCASCGAALDLEKSRGLAGSDRCSDCTGDADEA